MQIAKKHHVVPERGRRDPLFMQVRCVHDDAFTYTISCLHQNPVTITCITTEPSSCADVEGYGTLVFTTHEAHGSQTIGRSNKDSCMPTFSVATRRDFMTTLGRSAVGAATASLRFSDPHVGGAAVKKRSPIVDTHMHVWAADLKKYPFQHPFDKAVKPPKIAATVELLLEEMDQYGIDYCVLVQTIYHGWDNRYTVECVKKAPKRFKGHGLVDPTDPKVADKLEYWMREQGLAGMRINPIYYQKDGKDEWLTSPTHDALWKKAAELGAIFNYFIAETQLPKLEIMLRRHPAVNIVIDHFAYVDLKTTSPENQAKNLMALAKYPQVHLKVSELSSSSPSRVYPYKDTYDMVKRVYHAFGPDRLMWGTGYPGATRAQAKREPIVEELDLIRKEIPFFTAEDREKILGENAVRLWKFGPV